MGSLLALLFTMFSYIPSAIMEETNMGTVPFTVRLFKLTLFINVFYCALALGLGLTVLPGIENMPSMGLWPIIFCDMVI